MSTEQSGRGKTLYPKGEIIDGRYEIVGRVGYGATSDVYEARDSRDGAVVALKIVNQARLGDPVAQTRFHREAAVQAMVRHPHVAGILGNGLTAGDEPYLVLELFSGRCLRTILNEETRLDVQRACLYTLQILNGLAACHAIGVRHRDLKPENMMMRPTGDGQGEEVVLIDFGFASLEGQQRLTAQGFVVGSMSYIAPERLLGEPGDARADIYAVGVTLFEMLVGSKPFHGDDDKETALMHLEQEPPSISDVDPSLQIPAALEAVLRNALAKDAGARYQSAIAMAQALVSITGPRHTSPAATTAPAANLALHCCDADGRETRYTLGDEPILIGRAPECAIRSEDPLISRHHARIYRSDDGQYWIEDLDSTNGVWVGADRTTRAAIPADELVLVGSLVLQLREASGIANEVQLRVGFHTRLWMWLQAERAARLAVQDERNALGHRLGELYRALEELSSGSQEGATVAARKLAGEFKALRAKTSELRAMVQATEAEKGALVSAVDDAKRLLSKEIQRRTVDGFSAENERTRLQDELHQQSIELRDARAEIVARDGTLRGLRSDLEALSEEAVVGGQVETLALIAAQSERAKLAERVAELEHTCEELRRDLLEKDAELAAAFQARPASEESAEEAEELRKTVRRLTEEVERLGWSQHQGHSTVARLQVQLDLALAEVGELRSQDTSVSENNATARSQLELDKASLQERIAELEGQASAWRSGAKASEDELIRLREELLGARAEVEAAWAEVEHLRTESGGN